MSNYSGGLIKAGLLTIAIMGVIIIIIQPWKSNRSPEKKAEPGTGFRSGDTVQLSATRTQSAYTVTSTNVTGIRLVETIDSLSRLLSSYKKADSLNKINHYHGNGIGWYSVNPGEKK